MQQCKKIKQNPTGRENLDIYFYVVFNCYYQSFISGKETGH